MEFTNQGLVGCVPLLLNMQHLVYERPILEFSPCERSPVDSVAHDSIEPAPPMSGQHSSVTVLTHAPGRRLKTWEKI
jgi:hypothetical protein